MKCLYPVETRDVETSTIRKNKRYFLEKFKQDGFYLIDSLDSPFEEKYNSSQKINLIKKGQKELLQKIRHLSAVQTNFDCRNCF